MDQISERFYEYICEEIAGSEKVIQYRRKFFKVYDAILNRCVFKDIEHLSSGSLAEGMQLPGSDFDVMLVSSHYPVYEKSMINSNAYVNNMNALLLVTDLAQPGFASLRVHENSQPPCMVIETEHGQFLSNRYIKESLKTFRRNKGTFVKINGPCITDVFDEMDTAQTLRCETWPDTARHWLTRPRSDWPSVEVIQSIGEQGVLLVPIGSKSDSPEDNPMEWRMSFSAAEKVLIHSFSQTQFLCYAMLKILTKEVIKKDSQVDKLICSYFLKTTIFWLSEEGNADIWTPKTLLHCFELCLKRLHHWYSRGFIPNYFIPQHNMIDRKIHGQSRDKLIAELERLNNIGWICLLESYTFAGFYFWHFTRIQRGLEPEKALFTLFPLIIRMLYTCSCHRANHEVPILKKYLEASYLGAQNGSFSLKTICFTFLAHASHKLASSSLSARMLLANNKQQYQQRKEWMGYALLGTNSGSITGWLLVAVFFYINRNYHALFKILDLARMSSVMQKLNFSFLNHSSYIEVNRITKQLVKSSVFRNIRASSMQQISWINPFVDDYIGTIVQGSPVSFLHYLMFLCHNELGDLTQRTQDIENLKLTIENDKFFDNVLEKGAAVMYLVNAFRCIHDYESASTWMSVANDLLIEFEKIKEEYNNLAARSSC